MEFSLKLSTTSYFNAGTTIINQEIFGNGIAVQNNIYNNRYYIQHTRSEPDFPSLGMKSDDEPGMHSLFLIKIYNIVSTSNYYS